MGFQRNTNEILSILNWSKLFHQRAVNKVITSPQATRLRSNEFSLLTAYYEALKNNLRNSEYKLFVSQPRTNYCKRSFRYSGAVLWNGLPKEIKQSNSPLKMKLKNHSFQGQIIQHYLIYTWHPCKECQVASLVLVSVATVFYSLRMYLNENNVVKQNSYLLTCFKDKLLREYQPKAIFD